MVGITFVSISMEGEKIMPSDSEIISPGEM
jgi:hypothetical protein